MRRRVLLSMVLVTAVAVAVFAVPLGVAASRLYRSREVSKLEREATRAAGAFPSADGGTAPSPVLPESDPGVRLALYDRNGQLLTGTGPRTGGSEVRSAIGGRVTDDHDGAWLAVAIPVHDEQQIVGAARAAVSWDEVAGDSRQSWLVMAGIAGIAVGIAGLLAWSQTSRLVDPIDGLTGLAGRLGDGDFTARVAPTGVSEIDGAGRALNRTAERLGTLVERERAFTADVSHQLNTPLTSLRLALESALVTPGADATAAIETAIGEVERLEATVTTLLAVARDVAPVLGPPIDVGDVCAEIAERFRGDLAREGRPLHVDVAEGLPRTRVPVEVLREILAVL
ncbi:MAG: integral rane sensor signal transduction histidine kinase, partial [Acidimicrobiales bacterium]|nr:integral rane sensor signal transduction histidine kinase [Acidimicrobiales bacterium]